MLNVPPSRVPFGYVNVGGQRLEVYLNPEWARYLDSLNGQVVVTSSAVGLPGAPGQTGAAGSGISLGAEADGSTEFIPMPGPKGDQGEAGPVIFLMQEPENNDVFWPIRNT